MTKNYTYESYIEMLIRKKYSINDELAIQRQRDAKPEDFATYNEYCEDCKAKAKIYMKAQNAIKQNREISNGPTKIIKPEK